MLEIHIPKSALYCVFKPALMGWKRLDLEPKKGVYWLVMDVIAGEVNVSQIETFVSVLDPELTV